MKAQHSLRYAPFVYAALLSMLGLVVTMIGDGLDSVLLIVTADILFACGILLLCIFAIVLVIKGQWQRVGYTLLMIATVLMVAGILLSE